ASNVAPAGATSTASPTAPHPPNATAYTAATSPDLSATSPHTPAPAPPQSASPATAPTAYPPDTTPAAPDIAMAEVRQTQPYRQRQAHIERCERLLNVMRDMPGAVSWQSAQSSLEDELRPASLMFLYEAEPVRPYVALLVGWLQLYGVPDTAEQLTLLITLIRRLYEPLYLETLADAVALLTQWPPKQQNG
ncbi:MAG: hypothetical protein HC837_05460, partial [Chloroflexaceae bacterium]|nr:hypothetical protein [Chloroflexaceae bacterium]